MARNIDADNFRKTMIKRFGCIPCLTDYSEASRYDIPLDDALNLAPTADVVPKSEVEKLQEAYNNRLAKDIQTNAEVVKYAKAEVAREIFAEIEKETARVYNDFMYYQENAPKIAPYVIAFSDKIDIAIAELKKKYTEYKT